MRKCAKNTAEKYMSRWMRRKGRWRKIRKPFGMSEGKVRKKGKGKRDSFIETPETNSFCGTSDYRILLWAFKALFTSYKKSNLSYNFLYKIPTPVNSSVYHH